MLQNAKQVDPPKPPKRARGGGGADTLQKVEGEPATPPRKRAKDAGAPQKAEVKGEPATPRGQSAERDQRAKRRQQEKDKVRPSLVTMSNALVQRRMIALDVSPCSRHAARPLV